MKIKVSEAKRALSIAVRSLLLKDETTGRYMNDPISSMPIYLEGPPGIGKTALCSQVSRELNIGYVSYSIVHHTKNSILGLPVINELPDGRKHVTYTMSEVIADIYNQINRGYEKGILLLDEFPCISPTIAPVMLAFLQQKTLGEYKLPEGWVIVLAGNPKEFNKSSNTFDMATLDRVRKIEIMQDTNDYLQYAISSGVHQSIIDYLSINSKDCYNVFTEKGQEQRCVTCRSWSNLSSGIKSYEKMGELDAIDLPFVMQFIKDEVIARKFIEYYTKTRFKLSAEELRNIYYGSYNDTDKIDKVADLDYPNRYRLSELVINYSISHSIEQKKLLENDEWIVDVEKGLTNIYKFLMKIDTSLSLSERFTDKINKTPEMMEIISKVNVEQYNMDIIKKYDVA